MQRPRFSQFFFSTFLILFSVARLCAQGTSGVLTGTVADSSSAIIPGATVTISNPISGYSKTSKTDAQGQYRFANLPFGRYHVAVTSVGFRSATSDAQMRSASSITLDFKLSVTAGEEVVNVESEPEDMVNADPTSGNAVDRNLFARLPTESTNAPLSSLVSGSTPGIAGDSNGLFHPMGEHADTSFSIDGQPVSDQQSRVFGNQLSVNAIQSINVINGIAPPEYGDKASLVVQTTTRSGLNLPHPTGSLSYNYGSFGTSVGSLAVGFGGKRFGDFFTADGVDSSRYLDTPEFKPMHAKGNNENFFDRIDFNPSDKNLTQLNMTASRSWFQNPNQYDQAAVGQDQKAQIFSYNLSPSWTHILSGHSLFTVNPYLRQDNFHYYPSRNPFSDTPATLAQSRRLQNAGIKVDYSYSHGINTLKMGGMFYHTFLHEGFSLGITDATFNAPCLTASGAPDTNPSYTNPSQCPAQDTANSNFNPGSAPFDLTRGGTLYHFNGRTDIKQEAIYLQDTLVYKGFTFLLGGRIDNYNGLSSRSLVQPRLGATYLVKGTNTVLRLGYGKLFLTPYNENTDRFELYGCWRSGRCRVPDSVEACCKEPVRRGLRAGVWQAPGGERRVLLEVHGPRLRL